MKLPQQNISKFQNKLKYKKKLYRTQKNHIK